MGVSVSFLTPLSAIVLLICLFIVIICIGLFIYGSIQIIKKPYQAKVIGKGVGQISGLVTLIIGAFLFIISDGAAVIREIGFIFFYIGLCVFSSTYFLSIKKLK
ncbi:hypothetical protein NBRC116583_06950 [Arenicella sp. 4NH20-0111]|uniref:hypothetical protein n=1 Tax=Arenicella sp. 4NH20-0111 TaxID=3127648 RepID=UPI00310543FA